MKSRILKRRLIKARIVLNQTIQKILEISRIKKTLNYVEKPADKEQVIGDELWLLNKLAKKQAQLVKHYETVLVQENTTNTTSR
jgi:hypothetical protein